MIFILDINYTSSLDAVDKLLEAHRAFIKQDHPGVVFLISGPKNPRTGGVIIAKASNREDIERCCNADPFVTGGVCEYHITEISPKNTLPELSHIIQ